MVNEWGGDFPGNPAGYPINQNPYLKKTRCDSSAYVEVIDNHGTFLVRSSRSPAQFVVFSHEEWTKFLEAVKEGEFDL